MNLVPAFASEEPSSTGRKIFLLFKKKKKKHNPLSAASEPFGTGKLSGDVG